MYRLPLVAVLGALLTFGYLAAQISPAEGTPETLSAFNERYDTAGTRIDSCQLCHTSSIPALNPYGEDYKAHDQDFAAIEPLDSDGDGFTNIEEINARTFPGDPNDNPDTAQQEPPPPPATTTTTAPFPFSLLPSLSGLGTSGTGDLLSSLLWSALDISR